MLLCVLPKSLSMLLVMFNTRLLDVIYVEGSFFLSFFIEIPTVALDDKLRVFTSMVTAGNSVELKCDIKGAVEIVWQRNGAALDELITDDIQVDIYLSLINIL